MDCNACRERRSVDPIPYIVHEGEMARTERTIKRLWILCIVLVFMLVATNGAWLWRESQVEDVVTTTQEVTQSTTDGSNTFVGGDVIGNANG